MGLLSSVVKTTAQNSAKTLVTGIAGLGIMAGCQILFKAEEAASKGAKKALGAAVDGTINVLNEGGKIIDDGPTKYVKDKAEERRQAKEEKEKEERIKAQWEHYKECQNKKW